MILETLLGASVYVFAEYHKRGSSDAQRIQRIFRKCKLTVNYDKKEDTAKLIRSKKHEDYTEYIFRIPEGKSFKDFIDKREVIEDNLNSTKKQITLKDMLHIDFKGDIRGQIKELMQTPTTKKEVYMEGDRVLKVKVFNKPLTDFLKYEEIENKCKEWNVPIGYTRTSFIEHDFEKIPHMVVAGTTTYGKSVWLKSTITTLMQNNPETVSFTLVDLKGGLVFSRYRTCKQVLQVTSDPQDTLEALKVAQEHMEGVMVYLKSIGAENVREAKLPNRHFVIVDEAASLSPNIEKDSDLKKIKGECEFILSEIARKGGSLGFRLLYATQAPYREVLNPQIKQNCDGKLCFKLQTGKASEVVLGEGITDAADLPLIKGRAIYLTDRKYIVQTPMIENDYIERVVQHEN